MGTHKGDPDHQSQKKQERKEQKQIEADERKKLRKEFRDRMNAKRKVIKEARKAAKRKGNSSSY
jgi:hypothetical protein